MLTVFLCSDLWAIFHFIFQDLIIFKSTFCTIRVFPAQEPCNLRCFLCIEPLAGPTHHILSLHTKTLEANEGLKGWSPCKLGLAVFIQTHERLLLAKKEQPLSWSYIVNILSEKKVQIQTPKIKLWGKKVHLAISHMGRLLVTMWGPLSRNHAQAQTHTQELWRVIKY